MPEAAYRLDAAQLLPRRLSTSPHVLCLPSIYNPPPIPMASMGAAKGTRLRYARSDPMVKLPPHIANRIRKMVEASSKEGFHADHEAARHGGIALMGTIGSLWLLRPDGTIWDVDDDWGKPLAPLPEQLHTTALAAGVERHPWLSELLPERPDGAVDCSTCRGKGKLFPKNAVVGGSGIFCPDCSALGWRI